VRVWDIHPGYLSRQSLLGQHAEIHAIHSIITGHKKGYSSHPETQRWKRRVSSLEKRHAFTMKEMTLRGMGHHSPLPHSEGKDDLKTMAYVDMPGEQFALLKGKYTTLPVQGRIPLPTVGSEFWSHHKYSVMARGYRYYKEIQSFMRQKKDCPIFREDEFLMEILTLLDEPISQKEFPNLLEHLWGYVKKEADQKERDYFTKKPL